LKLFTLAIFQLDLIDCQAYPDNEYKFILNCQDHFTKFLHLHALKTKTAAEVAWYVMEIFLKFGAPCILQSDNGREFRAAVIEELQIMWPELKLVHGRPRHPQSQGSVERSNGEVKKLLGTWIRQNKSLKWSIGIKFVQLQYNSTHNKGMCFVHI
jgi:IS30 family transposase